ncbi:MAG TPA: GNAT family N-acetyltransferase [Longimicrobium sp.]|jgi:ribosomal protein S18 acetylase RimI-like enzyme|uniref:GNAT family N-acetyltransferase n=1 Tax=Longimicrobium sp. TaxID=2029185 RepID=UPI002EDB8C2F
MRIRDYTAADRAACLAVFDSNVPEFFIPAEREAFAGFLDGLPGPYLVVEDEDGAVVGCGGYAVTPGTSTADLCWGMVRRERHGTGLGRLLTEARMDRIHADPAAMEIALNTSQHTRAFYERRGFATERVVPDGFAPGLDRCDMRLILPPAAERTRPHRK